MAGFFQAVRSTRGTSLFLSTAVAAIMMAVSGCGSGDGYSTGTAGVDPLIGRWIKTSLTREGTFVTCPNNLTQNGVVVDSCGTGESIEFLTDGTYKIIYPAPRFVNLVQESGTYAKSGNTLILKRTSVGTDTNGDGQIQANEIVTLQSVTSANAIPSNPVQKIIVAYNASASSLELTGIPQSTTTASGGPVVNSDGTVNGNISDVTMGFVHP